ncbi:rCG63112, partial [Rattus norvegicus]
MSQPCPLVFCNKHIGVKYLSREKSQAIFHCSFSRNPLLKLNLLT